MSGLEMTGVGVRYGSHPVLEALSLPRLEPGQLTVLAGPNGAGKSTLLRAVAQVQRHSGQVLLDDQDLARLSGPARAALVGYMPQSLPAGAALVALEGVIAALKAGGSPDPRPESRAMETLERLGVASLAMQPMDRLSGGQRQMVALAQAVVRDPRLLLLDEPTSALDLARQVRLLAELRRIASEGRVVLAVLHDLALAARWADRIAVLQGGRLHSFGLPKEVLTPAMLAEVYGVEARVEHCSRGHLTVHVDGAGA